MALGVASSSKPATGTSSETSAGDERAHAGTDQHRRCTSSASIVARSRATRGATEPAWPARIVIA